MFVFSHNFPFFTVGTYFNRGLITRTTLTVHGYFTLNSKYLIVKVLSQAIPLTPYALLQVPCCFALSLTPYAFMIVPTVCTLPDYSYIARGLY